MTSDARVPRAVEDSFVKRQQNEQAHGRVFEPARLLDIFDNDLKAVGELLSDAITSIQEILDQAAVTLAAKNMHTLAGLVHELKGVTANVGADELSSLSSTLLERLRNDETIPADSLEVLRLAFARFQASVQAYLAGES